MVFENETRYGIPEEGVETAAFYLGPEHAGSIVRNCVIEGNDCSWGVKLAHTFDILFEDCLIRGATERALDMVRGGNITFRRCHFQRGEYRETTRKTTSLSKSCDIGIKGGARDVTFEDCTMNDLLLGDYSIYNQVKWPKTRRITLRNCTNSNGWPIIVRALDSEKAAVTNTSTKQLKVPSPFVGIYFWYNRKFGDKRVLTPDQFVLTAQDLQ